MESDTESQFEADVSDLLFETSDEPEDIEPTEYDLDGNRNFLLLQDSQNDINLEEINNPDTCISMTCNGKRTRFCTCICTCVYNVHLYNSM